jgi:hypothetical protein
MRETFIEKRFSAATLATIERANIILDEYERQGLVLTLRQVYYQFVSRGLMPNKQTEYKRLGSILSDGRLAGLIDWDMMEDRTRRLNTINAWGSPADVISASADQYQEDLWKDQPWRPEVWIEKDALVGVLEKPCEELRVPYFACRGYSSQSAQYAAGQRFRRYRAKGQTPIVFHLGDHDPSGIDMTRDNADRLGMFSRLGAQGVEVERLALNMDQVTQYNPPPNPAKDTDSRAVDYIAKYGTESWELDALEPTVIVNLIRDAVTPLIRQKNWKAAVKAEERGRNNLQRVSNNWDDIVADLP